MRIVLIILVLLALNGCAGGAAMMVVNAATMGVSAVTEKSVVDHAVSLAMDQDCNMMKRSDRDDRYCVDWHDPQYEKPRREIAVDQKVPVYTAASEQDAPAPRVLSAKAHIVSTLRPDDYSLSPPSSIQAATDEGDDTWKPLNLSAP